jgi:hypothetical protein
VLIQILYISCYVCVWFEPILFYGYGLFFSQHLIQKKLFTIRRTSVGQHRNIFAVKINLQIEKLIFNNDFKLEIRYISDSFKGNGTLAQPRSMIDNCRDVKRNFENKCGGHKFKISETIWNFLFQVAELHCKLHANALVLKKVSVPNFNSQNKDAF